MVRVISQKFSPPRSRHSSGETDRDLAERTNIALSSLGGKIAALEHNESSSDSFWDSEFDGEVHFSETNPENQDINGNDSSEKSDLQSKRKERRRERNKLSAQAYRKRRKCQSAKEKEQVSFLESKNRQLHKLVEKLEKDREQGRQFLRGCPVPMPDFLLPGHRSKKELNPVPEEPSVEETEEIYQDRSDFCSASSRDSFSSNQMSAQPSPLPVQPSPVPPKPSSFPPQTSAFPPQINEIKYNHSHADNAAPSFVASNESESNANPNPNANLSQFNLFPAHILSSDSLSQSSNQNPQILLQTHTLIGASVAPQEVHNFSTCTIPAIPAYVAVPVENSQYYTNANLNLNLACPVVSESNVNRNEEKLKESVNINANLAYGNSNQQTANSPVTIKTKALIGLVQVEMCNNNGNNSNLNPNLNLNVRTDDNGNTSNCDNCNTNGTKKSPLTSSCQNFNLNLNQQSANANNHKVFSEFQSLDVKPREIINNGISGNRVSLAN